MAASLPRVAPLVLRSRNGLEVIAVRLRGALQVLGDGSRLAHDDLTFVVAEFVDGPSDWRVSKNRLLRRRGR